MAGLKDEPGQQSDGESIVPLLKGGNRLKRQSIFWL